MPADEFDDDFGDDPTLLDYDDDCHDDVKPVTSDDRLCLFYPNPKLKITPAVSMLLVLSVLLC